MASNPYNYPPPPPPPPSQVVGPQQLSYQQYGQQQQQSQQHHQQPYQPRGGGQGRGRGNFQQGGRGNFHGSSQYNAPPGGYSAPGGYTGPAPVNNAYGQAAAPYGPQQPSSGYPLPQWPQEQQQHPPHQQLQHQPAPAPVPLSAQNYHPNYAPQLFNQPAYGQPPHQQQPYQQSPPQPAYSQHTPSSQPPIPSGPPPQHWSGPPHHSQPPYNGGVRGRGRGNPNRGSTRGGGRGGGRGGMDAPLMGPPIRMGFDNDQPANPVTQASNGFPPYPSPQHSSPPPYTQPPYQGPPPQQDFRNRGGYNGGQRGGYRAPLDPNPFHSNSRGGRGDRGDRGGRGGFNHQRGKRDPNTGDKARYRSVRDHNSKPEHPSHSVDPHQKPAQVIGGHNADGKKKKKKKRRTNTLGLTPRTEDHEDSEEEDDADEEARLAAVAANESVPQEPSDLEAWIAERKKKWPTKARREARELELAKRREMAREQSIRDKAKYAREREEKKANEAKLAKAQKEATTETKPAETKLERQQRKAEKLRKQLEKAEKRLQEALQAGSKRKREIGDTGDEEDDDNADGVDKANAAVTGPNADDSDSDNSDDSDLASDSDESAPEAQTSHRTAPDNVTLAPRPPVQRPCKYFSNGGSCGKKGKCRFLHDQAARDAALKEKAKGGRMTLSERLQQNEKENHELTVLKAIKYAAEQGILDDSTTMDSNTTDAQEVKGNVDMEWTSELVTVEAASEDKALEPRTHESSEATLDHETSPTLHPTE